MNAYVSSRALVAEQPGLSAGTKATEEKAEIGSNKLFDAMTLAFQRHTDRYGIPSINGFHPDKVSEMLLMQCRVLP